MNDQDLLSSLDQLLQLSKALPLEAFIYKASNGFTPLYKLSGVLRLAASRQMKNYHKSIVKTLTDNGYSVGLIASKLFIPHISVRLGVPFSKSTKARAVQQFEPGTPVAFDTWVVFRVYYHDGKRMMKEISLNA